jgi:hypothetical protein
LGRNLGEKSIWVRNHRMNWVNNSNDFSEVFDWSKGAVRFFNWKDGSVAKWELIEIKR